MGDNDIAGVTATVNLYACAVDTQQWDLFDRAFTSDVSADFGPGAVWHDLAAFKRDFATIHAPFASTQHVTTNHVITVAGDEAHCLSYVHGRFVRDVGEGGNMFESSGWYDDRLVRTAAGWRIGNRVCRMVWWGGNPRVLQTVPDIPIEHHLDSLRAEAAAGRIGFVEALRKA